MVISQLDILFYHVNLQVAEMGYIFCVIDKEVS